MVDSRLWDGGGCIRDGGLFIVDGGKVKGDCGWCMVDDG